MLPSFCQHTRACNTAGKMSKLGFGCGVQNLNGVETDAFVGDT